jgi:amino acid transporter
VNGRRAVTVIAVVAGIVLIVIAILYWVEPAKSLPSFFPGHQSGSSRHHTKHGIAAFLLGIACLVFAWFQSGTQHRPPESR